MNRARTLELLRQHKPFLVEQFGVTDLALFGSVARDTAVSDSDIDILVSFNGPATSSRYFGVQFFIEDAFGRSINVATRRRLCHNLTEFVSI